MPPVEMPSEIPSEIPQDTSKSIADSIEEPIFEAFYTFTWVGNRPVKREFDGRSRGQRSSSGKPAAKDQERSRGKPKGGRPPRSDKPKNFSARPPKKDKIDPDNPFAALLALKDKS